MMKATTFFIAITLILLTSCKTKSKSVVNEVDQESQTEIISDHNSKNSLDWTGIYEGTMPCDDCDGIKTKIELNQDLSYTKTTQHLGISDTEEKTSGTFSWNKSGSNISLDYENSFYKVGENILIPLDGNGNLLTNNLKKATMDSEIKEVFWKLVELNGQRHHIAEDRTAVYIELKNKDNIVTGYGGCNFFNGTYTLDEDSNRLHFSNMKSTMRACDRMETERLLYDVLKKTDNYTIKNDTLSLNKARMAPLAKFAAVLR
ncbi:MAG TPA: copper resistance protein NlpE N-terminal domain-containing protein [Aequorivita sp.]|nr:copper resistance protein NlpE N-terminal domain-containing protein [Aequorivita sp.]